MHWSNARILFIPLILVFLALADRALSDDHTAVALERWHYNAGIYTSPTGYIRCDIGDYEPLPGFFVNEAYDPGESETLSFGVDSATHFDVWTIRVQKEGRIEYTPNAKEGFPVTEETFVPYYYSELPYELESVKPLSVAAGKAEVLRVQMIEKSQLHAYWLDENQGWLISVQFVPTLAETKEHELPLETVRRALRTVLDQCTFK